MPALPLNNEAKRAAGMQPCRIRDTLELPSGVPRCPIKLNRWGKRAWGRLIPVLVDAKVLTKADGLAVGILARAIGDLDEAEDRMNKSGGAVIAGRLGDTKMNPWGAVRQRAFNNVRDMLTPFGLTPAARLKVQKTATVAGEEDPLEGMLK
jgi:P27 family predicted phage terminase small subunit